MTITPIIDTNRFMATLDENEETLLRQMIAEALNLPALCIEDIFLAYCPKHGLQISIKIDHRLMGNALLDIHNRPEVVVICVGIFHTYATLWASKAPELNWPAWLNASIAEGKEPSYAA